MKSYDLLIVGNGFDLGSGYDTSYKKFLEDNSRPLPKNFLFQLSKLIGIDLYTKLRDDNKIKIIEVD